MAYWRDASTVILAAKSDSADKLSHLVFDYEVLLLKRSKALKFHSGQYVYPGGVVSSADFDHKWAELYAQISQCSIQEVSVALSNNSKFPPILRDTKGTTGIPRNIALRITAIRETFEEAGVALLVNKPRDASTHHTMHEGFAIDQDQLQEWREKVVANPAMFLKMCEHFGVVPDVWSLMEWSNWLTPVMRKVTKPPKKPMRYDTMFFLCCADSKPQVYIDKVETSNSKWTTPESLVWQRSEGNIICGEPQTVESLRLYRFESLMALWQFSIHKACNFIVKRYLVVVLACADGLISVYPGDDCYPDHPDVEGLQDILTTPQTIEENRNTCRYLHRVEMASDQTGRIFKCNIPEDCMEGQRAPASAVSVVDRVRSSRFAKL